jgi:hypothetical protein
VWRLAALGGVGEDGEHDGSKVGRFVVCQGKEGREVRMAEVTGWINAFGTWTKERKGGKVVVSLSNCVEMLACVFGMVPFPYSFCFGSRIECDMMRKECANLCSGVVLRLRHHTTSHRAYIRANKFVDRPVKWHYPRR